MSAPAPSREPHILALKVLRASRPTLVPSATPYSEETSLEGLALKELDESSIEHAAGFAPLTGALMLPSNFGTIYLGETFSALLSLSNDLPSTTHALAPVLKVEMHTTGPGPQGAGGSKHHLKTIYAPPPRDALGPGESVEGMISHEIKELGMHALVCTITYGVRSGVEEGLLSPKSATNISRSFRKVYKFQVSNPLSVRTKAHAPSPLVASSSLSPIERQKVFLEVQVQNQGEHAMSFERMHFDPVPGWTCFDVNSSTPGLFKGVSALLSPQAVRQYLFVLSQPLEAEKAVPGSSQPLGRLDIVWRTPHGEIGRLQTSMLGRRVPIPPPGIIDIPPPPSLVDKALPGPPQTPIKTPAPYRPSGSPSSQQSSPATLPRPPPIPLPVVPDSNGLEFDLTVHSITPGILVREHPFTILFSLNIKDRSLQRHRKRKVRIVAQHVQWHESPLLFSRSPPLPPPHQGPPRLPSPILSLPGGDAPLHPLSTTSLQQQQQLTMRSSTSSSSYRNSSETPSIIPSSSFTDIPLSPTLASVIYPRPTPLPGQSQHPTTKPSRDLVMFGASTVELGELILESRGGENETPTAAEATKEFELQFLPLAQGLLCAGGVRILLVESDFVEEGIEEEDKEKEPLQRKAKIVLELDTVAEVWVRSKGTRYYK